MPPQYIFPCQNCDHKFTLVPRQSGQELVCPQCNQPAEAPMLGKMKQLELVEGTQVTPPRKSSAGSWKNSLFTGGLAIAILFGAGGFSLYRYASWLHSDYDFDEQITTFESEVDAFSQTQVVALYESMNVKDGLGDWFEPEFIRYNKQAEILLPVSYGMLGLALLGFVSMIGSFFIKP